MQKTVAFHTLGCKLNFTDTSAIAQQFNEAGYKRVPFGIPASVYVVNTCSVTDNADKECKTIVNKIQREAPHALVVVTGCYAQLKPDFISSIPGVDIVVGAQSKFNILAHIENIEKGQATKIAACEIDDVHQFVPAQSLDERTRVFLKVQDGCSYNCSFCTIPLARGSSRSDSVHNALNRINNAIADGAHEVVLTGVNLGDFGVAPNSGARLSQFIHLLQAIEQLQPAARIRLSSVEPNLMDAEIIHLIASSKVIMPHFHMPLQSGSNSMLASMRRRYRSELYSDRVSLIKQLMPHACIGADVITGFMGESEQYFIDTYQFIHAINISYLHVFTYSERANTHAISLAHAVPMQIRKARTQKLRMLSQQKTAAFYNANKGSVRNVLFEHGNNKSSSTMEGYTDNYIRVQVPLSVDNINAIVPCKLHDVDENMKMQGTALLPQLI